MIHALVVWSDGRMSFKGDYADFDVQLQAGDVRWVRPGFDYGPEYNYGEPMQITVRRSCTLTLPMRRENYMIVAAWLGMFCAEPSLIWLWVGCRRCLAWTRRRRSRRRQRVRTG